ncbi:MAG: hypothetical protein ACXWX7_03875 [Candidatus Binatia bacterium]
MGCSAPQTTAPLPPTSKSRPITVALRHSCRLGVGSPQNRRQRYSTAPDMMKRAAADKNGGVVSTVKRIAR